MVFLKCLELLFASAFIIAGFFLNGHIRDIIQKKMHVTITNLEDYDAAFCWRNPDIQVQELIANPSAFCSRIAANGEDYHMRTFISHRFISFPWNKSTSDDVNFTTIVILPDILKYNIINREDTAQLSFMSKGIELWGISCNLRHQIGLGYAFILLVITIICSEYRRKTDELKMHPYIPRNSLKCYAVIAMLFNHLGHMLYTQDHIASKVWFTLPADFGGSTTIFWWLAGYNAGDTRSTDLIVIASYAFLVLSCSLPSPITYESLLTIVTIRKLVAINATRNLLSKNVILQGFLCGCLTCLSSVLGSDGLKLLHVQGIMLGLGGVAFSSSTAIKKFIWILPAGFIILRNNVKTFQYEEYFQDGKIFIVAYYIFLGVLFLLLLLVFLCPRNKSAWKTSDISNRIAHYSLEIYVGHFLFLRALKSNFDSFRYNVDSAVHTGDL